MRKDYAYAKQRLIIFGEDDGLLKPVDKPNPEAGKKKMTEALRHLAQDRKNEIWMVTDQDVKAFEEAYGHIPYLNFAGRHGIQLSQLNKKSAELPNAGLINEIENEVSKRIPYLPNTLMLTPFTPVEYSRQYLVPHEREVDYPSCRIRADR
ncbi:hypothetical protein PCASD_15962 [Puccinia coronata f. sp. avenae]|uniref:Trehalose 6-phosphate phosphatase n=1 Tax=Puccinia coronata f. sp. avenae TaxID=200324 RepID=A0A2N5TZ99_9BASI|nr:hypothetical protein PCASD_15847 [Puccinia coronata f. sp. avenae]PLW30830.1 hypothetical protein PCASD_15962 [Puccinia coronata f. sp. avenae]